MKTFIFVGNFFVGTFVFVGTFFFAGPLYLYEPFLQTFFLWELFMETLDFLSEAASAEQREQMGKLE